MPDDEEFDDEDQADEPEAPGEAKVSMARADIRRLEKAAKRADAAEAKLAEFEKRDTFLRAGVDLDSPVGQLLFDGYKGDVDRDAIAEAAEKVGALRVSAAAEAPSTEASAEEQQATDERRELSAGAQPGTFREEPADPYKVAIDAGEQAMRDGATRDGAIGTFFEKVAEAAIAGDKRVIWDPNRER